MKKLLFIGHEYHKKTKSADFIIDLLKTQYDVKTFYFDPYKDSVTKKFNCLKNYQADVICLWQIGPDIQIITNQLKCSKICFFPMYDGSWNAPNEFWYSYRNVKIINFSKTLHDKLVKIGLDSHYIQFFPKPMKSLIPGDTKKIFFWKRINLINLNIIQKLFKNISIDKIHIHKCMDPLQTFVPPPKNFPMKPVYSDWYPNKKDMLKDILEAQIYIAPRHHEGIGMSFLEAMSMGRCVVAPNLPTMNEYIKDGENGILYDLKNPQPLKKFDSIQIGKNAFKYIQNGYKNWEKEQKNILKWIDEPLKINKKRLRKMDYTRRSFYLFGCIPLFTIMIKDDRIKIYILKILPFIKIKKRSNKIKIYLFSILPLLKIKKG